MSNDYKNRLIRLFHTLLREAKIDDENKMMLLNSYGVESSKDLEVWQLSKLCTFLQNQLSPEDKELDAQRKKFIAIACSFCEAICVKNWDKFTPKERVDYAKAIACKAAEVNSFNSINGDRLRRIAYMLKNRTAEMKNVEKIMVGEINIESKIDV